jgi:hypothetical protein
MQMATPAKRSTKNQGATLPENHSPSEAVAHSIVLQYADLTPSVKRIMASELSEAGLRLGSPMTPRESLNSVIA